MTAPSFDRTANVVGALALVVTDRMTDAMADRSGHSASAAAALSALHHFLDRPSIDRLRQVLGLTSSGTVRLVDRLEQEGYVERGPGADGRTIAVSLTARGRRQAAKVSAARADVLAGALGALSGEEREALDRIASKLLVGLMRGPGGTGWMCRLCDFEACGHDKGECPIVKARAST